MSIQQANIPFHYEAYLQLAEEMSPHFTPAYMHGMVWAMLAVFGESGFQDNPFFKKLNENEWALFQKLFQESVKQTQHPEQEVQLLLPCDESPLSQRLEALRDWCEGFLQGLQLIDTSGKQLALPPSCNEIVSDIENISGISCDEVSTKENEAAYMELVEYLRVAVMLLIENQSDATLKDTEETAFLH